MITRELAHYILSMLLEESAEKLSQRDLDTLTVGETLNNCSTIFPQTMIELKELLDQDMILKDAVLSLTKDPIKSYEQLQEALTLEQKELQTHFVCKGCKQVIEAKHETLNYWCKPCLEEEMAKIRAQKNS